MTVRCGPVNVADRNGVQFTIIGDGTGNVFKCALNKPPFNLTGIAPSIVKVDTNQGGLTATGVISPVVLDTILTLTFSDVIPIVGVGPDVKFLYDSVP